MSKLRLHIAEIDDFSADVMADLRNKFDVSVGPVHNLKETLKLVDLFWFRLNYKIDASVLNRETRCKYILSPVTGIDHIDEELCSKLGIEIFCLRNEYEFLKTVRATSEHTILLTQMLLRNAFGAISNVHEGNWNRDLFRGNEIFGKKIGIIGYGRLGRIVGDYFNAMEARVGFYDIVEKEFSSAIDRFGSMDELLETSDIISVHVPYNKSTHGMINMETFKKMKSNAVLINTSRGGVIKEEDLLTALEEKIISGAALDVLVGESNISNNPLVEYARSNSNLIITPHIGGCTYESFAKTEKFLADKLLKNLELNEA